MLQTRRKGNRNQLKAIKKLEEQGYLVTKIERVGFWIKEKDAWGLFDLCSISTKHIKFVQISTNQPHAHKSFIAFSKKYDIQNVVYEQWCWKDRKGFKRWQYKSGKKVVLG